MKDDSHILIQHAELKDLAEIQTLFANTIKTVCRKDYSPEQIETWVSSIEDHGRWVNKLEMQYFLVARINNKIVGFSSLQNKDYLDFLYVHKDHQRKGIASKLYHAIETAAMERGSVFLKSDVSITAKSFFISRGFKVVREQLRMLNGVGLVNYEMIKELPE